jgi:hypothetical protein
MRKAFQYLALTTLALLSFVAFAKKGEIVYQKGAFLKQLQERDSILIADQLLYGVDLNGVEEGTMFAFPQLQDTLMEGVEIVRGWQLDTLNVTKGKKGAPNVYDIRGGIVITSFEQGQYPLPPLSMQRMTKEGVVDTLVFDSQMLDVKTMPVDTTTFKLHDIKGQIQYPITFMEVLPWIGIVLGILAVVALIVWLIKKYGKKRGAEAERKEPAHIVALRKLDKYKGNKMWAPERQKAFYSGVTDALREYIDARYDIGAMEMTTAEIMKELKKTDISEELQIGLKDLFERADYVKFAKYVASDEDNATALPMAVRFVASTYQMEVEGGSFAGAQDDMRRAQDDSARCNPKRSEASATGDDKKGGE